MYAFIPWKGSIFGSLIKEMAASQSVTLTILCGFIWPIRIMRSFRPKANNHA